MGKRKPGEDPIQESRTGLALGELCSRLGYCDARYKQEAIFANPPRDADAFVDAARWEGYLFIAGVVISILLGLLTLLRERSANLTY